ncbi:MAG: hypothetical protein JHC99_05250 [Brevundimonas sp.]|nr:hypothetical protein [Brevundimonas sp.]
MGQTGMTLLEVLNKITSYAPEDFIFLKLPWNHDSLAEVVNYEIGEKYLSSGTMSEEYFCEVFSLLDFFGEEFFQDITQRKTDRVIEYAKNDC